MLRFFGIGMFGLGLIARMFPFRIPFLSLGLIAGGLALLRISSIESAKRLRQVIRKTPGISAVELELNEELPRVCVICGTQADHFASRAYTVEEHDESREATISLPLCSQHAVDSSILSRLSISCTGRHVLILDVALDFAEAVREAQQARSRAVGDNLASMASNYQSPDEFLRNLT